MTSAAFFGDKNCTKRLNRAAAEKKSVFIVRTGAYSEAVAKAHLDRLSCAEGSTLPTDPAKMISDDWNDSIQTLQEELLKVGVLSFKSVRKASNRRTSSTGPRSGSLAAARAAVQAGESVILSPTEQFSVRRRSQNEAPAPSLPPVPVLQESTPSGMRRRRVSIELSPDHTSVVVGTRAEGSGVATDQLQALVRDHATTDGESGVADYKSSYKIDKELGAGCFGMVSRVIHTIHGGTFAMKHINLAKLGAMKTLNLFLSLREIELMKKLDHPNIIKIHEIFRNPSDIYIVMELCTGGELQDLLEAQPPLPCPPPFPPHVPRFALDAAKRLLTDMLGALQYIHSNGICHRDLKLENFIFSGPSLGEGQIKMIDFGLSRTTYDSELMEADVGSCSFKAPEVIKGSYTEACDMWSLGVIAHMMVTGIGPWEGDTPSEITASILKECSNQEAFHSYLDWFYGAMEVSSECGDFVKSLLTVSPDDRSTAEFALVHHWILGSKIRSRVSSLRRAGLSRSSSLHDERKLDDAQLSGVVSRLKKFKKQNRLKRTALLAITFSLGQSDIDDLSQQFNKMDVDSDGTISFEEFKQCMAEHGHTDEREIRDWFNAIDQDRSGVIQFSEFMAAAMDEKLIDENQLEAAFQRLDVDKSGFIGEDDMMMLLGKANGVSGARKIMNDADKDGDGTISYGEFKRVMRRLSSESMLARRRLSHSVESTPVPSPVSSPSKSGGLAGNLVLRTPSAEIPIREDAPVS